MEILSDIFNEDILLKTHIWEIKKVINEAKKNLVCCLISQIKEAFNRA